jgi:response regulator RpfG family c-di-GMP phosphodiesterase
VVLHLVPNFEAAAKMVRHHHENFNGTGFPNRLKGENIPMGARIIAVADGYDEALNSRANFHDAAPRKAMAWLENRTGFEYDPADEKDEVEIAIDDLRQGMK